MKYSHHPIKILWATAMLILLPNAIVTPCIQAAPGTGDLRIVHTEQMFDAIAADALSRFFQPSQFMVSVSLELDITTSEWPILSLAAEDEIMYRRLPGLPVGQTMRRPQNEDHQKRVATQYQVNEDITLMEVTLWVDEGLEAGQQTFMQDVVAMALKLRPERGDIIRVVPTPLPQPPPSTNLFQMEEAAGTTPTLYPDMPEEIPGGLLVRPNDAAGVAGIPRHLLLPAGALLLLLFTVPLLLWILSYRRKMKRTEIRGAVTEMPGQMTRMDMYHDDHRYLPDREIQRSGSSVTGSPAAGSQGAEPSGFDTIAAEENDLFESILNSNNRQVLPFAGFANMESHPGPFISRLILSYPSEMARLIEMWIQRDAIDGTQRAARIIYHTDPKIIEALEPYMTHRSIHAIGELLKDEEMKPSLSLHDSVLETLARDMKSRFYKIDGSVVFRAIPIFDFLDFIDNMTMVTLIDGQPASTSSAALSYLPQRRVAGILSQLNPEKANNILHEISEAKRMKYRELEEHARSFFQAFQLLQQQRSETDSDWIISILENMPSPEMERYAASFKKDHPEQFEAISKLLVMESSLARLPEEWLREAIRTFSISRLPLLLSSLEPEMADRLLACRPGREQELLRRDMLNTDEFPEEVLQQEKKTFLEAVRAIRDASGVKPESAVTEIYDTHTNKIPQDAG